MPYIPLGQFGNKLVGNKGDRMFTQADMDRIIWWEINDDSITSPYKRFRAPWGSAGHPGYSFDNKVPATATELGMYALGQLELGFAVGGSIRLSITSNVRVGGDFDGRALMGGTPTASLMAYGFNNDPNTGMRWLSADSFGLYTGGVVRLTFADTLLTSSVPIFLPAGAVTATSVQLNDTDTGIYSTGTGIMDVAAAGTRVMTFNASGVANDNDATLLPHRASASPSQITSFPSTGTWTAMTGTTITLWDHTGTNRDVQIAVWGRGAWGETAAVAYTGEVRVAVSTDGGSSWTTQATSINYMGTGTGGQGYRGEFSVMWQGQVAAASVTGDIQARLEWKVSNTNMDRLVQPHIQGIAEQIF